jgi:uncharacterized protein YegP (UPF0339 family)
LVGPLLRVLLAADVATTQAAIDPRAGAVAWSAFFGPDHRAPAGAGSTIGPSSTREGYVPAKFVVKKGPTGKFRFNLLSSNGQVIATSQAYERKAACIAGVAAVQKSAAGAKMEDLSVPAPKPAAAKSAAKKPAAKKPAARKS